MMKQVIKVSVRNIVEFSLKHGSIDSGFSSRMTAVEGTKGHRIVQKLRIQTDEAYRFEVPISYMVEDDEVILEISGRIDGMYEKDGRVTIEEIKTTEHQLEYIQEDFNIMHMAQAKIYAYMYGVQNGLTMADTVLTYYHRGTGETKSFYQSFKMEELSSFFYSVVNKYLKWANIINSFNMIRDESIKNLKFPFDKYRKGQRELAVAAYKTICSGKKIFAEAPTGIGKTIATIFPAVKAVGQGEISRMFYLTAKTSTRSIAEEAFDNLRKNGLKFRTITLTAKEKVCFQEKVSCKPEDCLYANGYYDRIDDAIEDILEQGCFTKESIINYSKKHNVCPFEFSLDLSFFCDGIICDYNYVFDPRVNLKRFFAEIKEDYGFLIDEAHNLVDRAREMFSAEIFKSKFLDMKNELRKDYPSLKKSLNEINSYFIKLRKECEEKGDNKVLFKEQLKDICPMLEKFIQSADSQLSKNQVLPFREKLMELYFEALNFIKISELYDEKYVSYIEKSGSEVKLKLFCLDPSRLLSKGMERGKSSILFSATLSPIEYFIGILGGDVEDYKIRINSPFEKSNLCLLLADNINTQYHLRELSYMRVAEYIYSAVNIRRGNYIAFFPSYKYMDEVYKCFTQGYDSVKTICQRSSMTEEERDDFLKNFTNPCSMEESLLGFAVMGGAFGEGIDLAGDKLIGAIIVGVGLPQICLERDIIREYFSTINNEGFEYAYVYPGMNKVLQAAGRVIRTEKDRGVVFLIDERFSRIQYKRLMPIGWSNMTRVRNSRAVTRAVERFWEHNPKLLDKDE